MRIKRLPILISLKEGPTIPRQIASAIRDAILERRLSPGDPLPSSRDLAEQLGVARNTVLAAIEMLVEGELLETMPGVGTFIKSKVSVDRDCGMDEAYPFVLTDWAHKLPDVASVIESTGAPLDLRPGLPDLRSIPFDEWRRSAVRKIKTMRTQIGSYGEASGNDDLRSEIAQYVARSRSVVCDASQVIVTSGAQQAFDLIARVLIRPGQKAAVEEPGYQPAIKAFSAAGAEIYGVPVDNDGLDVSCLPNEASIIYVTPSHQYPLGVTMSDTRRQDLLAWATLHSAFIIEDDYDSEFRYTRSALPALQARDTTDRVIYVGTFSKNLMPGIRLGYLILPRALCGVFSRAKWLVDRHSDNVSQSVLSEFMSSGFFSRHIVTMRKMYAERNAAITKFRDAFANHGANIVPSKAGLHVCVLLPPEKSEAALILAAKGRNVGLYGLRETFSGPPAFPGLIIGFGNIGTRDIEVAMERTVSLL